MFNLTTNDCVVVDVKIKPLDNFLFVLALKLQKSKLVCFTAKCASGLDFNGFVTFDNSVTLKKCKSIVCGALFTF